MAEFSVRTRELERWSQGIDSEANKVRNYGHRVEQINRDCSLEGTAGINVKRNLAQMIAELGREARDLGNMGKTLEYISALYRSAEARIVSDGKIIPPMPPRTPWGPHHGGRTYLRNRMHRRAVDGMDRRYPPYPNAASGLLPMLVKYEKSITKRYSSYTAVAALAAAGSGAGMYHVSMASHSVSYGKVVRSLEVNNSSVSLGTKVCVAREVKSKVLRYVRFDSKQVSVGIKATSMKYVKGSVWGTACVSN